MRPRINKKFRYIFVRFASVQWSIARYLLPRQSKTKYFKYFFFQKVQKNLLFKLIINKVFQSQTFINSFLPLL